MWAWEQFPIDVDDPDLTKSSLYRGPITRAAVKAVSIAIARIVKAANQIGSAAWPPLSALKADHQYAQLSVTDALPFQGGETHHRPLLKAAQRSFDPKRHSSVQVSRCIRCADSQPGVLTKLFGPKYYVCGGQIEHGVAPCEPLQLKDVTIIGVRNEAVCIATADNKGIWITHLRRPKIGGGALWPKVPALPCLWEDNVLTLSQSQALSWPLNEDYSPSPFPTFQEISLTIQTDANSNKTAHLSFAFYNGAMSTPQCQRLIAAMDYTLTHHHTPSSPLRAVVLAGSNNYFSNGIALNVIEASADPSQESWENINAIDDVVHYLLHTFPAHNILVFAAIRGNAAAGGVALAAACDFVIAGSEVVLNPAYRAIGLYGSEYHSLSYTGRCGAGKAKEMLRAMVPMSPYQAQRAGLVDYVFPGSGAQLDGYIESHVEMLLRPGCLAKGGFWKASKGVDLSASGLAKARTMELGEMGRDFWSARSARYHARRFDFVRKIKSSSTPLRFAKHRRNSPGTLHDEEERDDFDDVAVYEKRKELEMRGALLMELRSASVSSSNSNSTVSTAATTPTLAEEKENLFAKLAAAKLEKGGVEADGGRGAQTILTCYYQPENCEARV